MPTQERPGQNIGALGTHDLGGTESTPTVQSSAVETAVNAEEPAKKLARVGTILGFLLKTRVIFLCECLR